jgi:hypothetical protein
VTLALSNSLTGHDAQQAIGLFDLFITLTSTDVPAPDGCTPAVAPPAGRDAADGSFSASVTLPGSTGGDAARRPGTAPDVEKLPYSGGEEAAGSVYRNTDRFYQEYFVAWWVVAFLLGGAFAWWRSERRERIPE